MRSDWTKYDDVTKNVRSYSPPAGSRGAQTRARILRAAGKIIGRSGYRKATITAIAEAAGVGKATVYLYFKDKQEILTRLVQKEAEVILDSIRRAVEPETTVSARLRAFILTRYRSVHSLLRLYNTTSQVLLEDMPSIAKATADYGEKEIAMVQAMLLRGQHEGELGDFDAHLAATVVTGTLRSLDQPWIFQHLPLDLEQRVDDLVFLFLNGLIARKDPS